MFQKASKKKAKLRLALTGATGAGKTFSALLLARKLGKRVALIDSERGSASLYADRFDFDTVDLVDHSIDTYKRAIRAAATAGYDVLVIDSMSHEWMGKGGALETVDRLGGGNKFTNGWGQVTPMHTGFLDEVLSYPGHVVATMRSKMEYELVKDEKTGKIVPKKVGLAPVQRDGVTYEMSVVLDLHTDGTLHVDKTRCSALDEMKSALRREDIEKVGDLLLAWLNDGAEPPPEAPKPEQPKPAAAPAANPEAAAALTERIKAAGTLVELAKLAPEVAKLAEADKAVMRPLYGARQDALKKAAAETGKAA